MLPSPEWAFRHRIVQRLIKTTARKGRRIDPSQAAGGAQPKGGRYSGYGISELDTIIGG
jgi:hypothetical protein